MSYPLSFTDEQVFTAVRAFLLDALSGFEIVQGNVNRVPTAKGNFVVMSRTTLTRLGTNTTVYDDQPLATPSVVALKIETQPINMAIQLDVYGPSAPDAATVISTAWRSDIACDFLSSYGIQPLYNEEPRWMPLTNSEEQYENRYMVEVYLQYNPSIAVAQQFFDVVDGSTIRVDPVDIFIKEN